MDLSMQMQQEPERERSRRFYANGNCVRLRRVDDTGSEHDEFLCDTDSVAQADALAEQLNRGGLSRIWIPKVGLRNLMRRGYGDYYPPRESDVADFTEYTRADIHSATVKALRFQQEALHEICDDSELMLSLPPSVHAKLANMRDDVDATFTAVQEQV